jgi:hypothetical protein
VIFHSYVSLPEGILLLTVTALFIAMFNILKVELPHPTDKKYLWLLFQYFFFLLKAAILMDESNG